MVHSLGQLMLVSDQAVLKLGLDEVYKLTIICTGQKGSYSDPLTPNHFVCLILMTLKGTNALGAFDGVLFNATIPTSPAAGFAAIGADSYGLDDFDNYLLPLFKTQTHVCHVAVNSLPLWYCVWYRTTFTFIFLIRH
ncbi:galactocerebrosidase isoform X2 [Biomphalaria glabrata]|nr:galactocerebrosidase isoform X2 [Biomphalaria glabrata]